MLSHFDIDAASANSSSSGVLSLRLQLTRADGKKHHPKEALQNCSILDRIHEQQTTWSAWHHHFPWINRRRTHPETWWTEKQITERHMANNFIQDHHLQIR
jgi:hypothetical protein